MKNYNKEFMAEAIEISINNVKNGGGPFGCIIAQEHKIISRGVNLVTDQNDPTAHAEIVAIRNACQHLNSFQLDGCHLYTSCEPCPMCLGAIYWSRPAKVYFANTKADAAKYNFDDQFIYDEIQLAHADRSIPMIHIQSTNAIDAFRKWDLKDDRIKY